MSILGKKIIVTNPVFKSDFYDAGDVMRIKQSSENFDVLAEGSIITECGNLFVKGEYQILWGEENE